jgi:hypothetical protein
MSVEKYKDFVINEKEINALKEMLSFYFNDLKT